MKRLFILLTIVTIVSIIIFTGCGNKNSSPSQLSQKEPSESTEHEKAESSSSKQEQMVPMVTMKKAFELLKKEANANDLKLYSYNAFSINSEGQSNNFDIVGYSPAAKKNYWLRVDVGEVELDEINNPDIEGITFYDIDSFKDSKELVSEAIEKVGKWDDEKCLLSIHLAKEEAELGALNKEIGITNITYLK